MGEFPLSTKNLRSANLLLKENDLQAKEREAITPRSFNRWHFVDLGYFSHFIWVRLTKGRWSLPLLRMTVMVSLLPSIASEWETICKDLLSVSACFTSCRAWHAPPASVSSFKAASWSEKITAETNLCSGGEDWFIVLASYFKFSFSSATTFSQAVLLTPS